MPAYYPIEDNTCVCLWSLHFKWKMCRNLEAAQMRILRPLLSFTKLHTRKTQASVNNYKHPHTIKDIIQYQERRRKQLKHGTNFVSNRWLSSAIRADAVIRGDQNKKRSRKCSRWRGTGCNVPKPIIIIIIIFSFKPIDLPLYFSYLIPYPLTCLITVRFSHVLLAVDIV